MKVSIGVEGTFAPQCGKDTLAITGHYKAKQWRKDLEIIRGLGLEDFRYPVPWHRIERNCGEYTWTSLDAVMAYASDLNLSIIADPLHHTSYPDWLTDGFANPEFPKLYVQFVRAFAERYPHIVVYTPFNEPGCTLDFSGYRGFWHPYHKADSSYVTMLRNTARATAEVVHMLRAKNRNVQILHVDTYERHAAGDNESVPRAEFLNERRFLFEDLICGRVTRGHRLHAYLTKNGFPKKDLMWHLENPVRIDERGGNYYPLNEEELLHNETWRAPSRNPVGPAEIILEYAARLPYPLSFTETNIQGTVRDRISWLKYVLEQIEKAGRAGVRMRSFAWYPLFDCAGWNCLLQGSRWKRDPQGIISCGRNWERIATELTDLYAKVAGGAKSEQLPAYEFTSTHDRTLAALKRQMKWNWVEQ
jgi:beta-glucosidase/6-phospho-beta-glucosidase/beta-galactosidase